MHFVARKKSRKHSGFVIYSSCKYSAFTAVKRDEKVLTRYVKGVSFVNRRYMTGAEYLFCEKWYIKGEGVEPRGGASPYQTFLSSPAGVLRN